jgi:hypothetical protein
VENRLQLFDEFGDSPVFPRWRGSAVVAALFSQQDFFQALYQVVPEFEEMIRRCRMPLGFQSRIRTLQLVNEREESQCLAAAWGGSFDGDTVTEAKRPGEMSQSLLNLRTE